VGSGLVADPELFIHELTGARSAEVNRQIIADNAALAAEVAVACSATAGADG
jgi:pseudouridine-5'-phosphate glycosidase